MTDNASVTHKKKISLF